MVYTLPISTSDKLNQSDISNHRRWAKTKYKNKYLIFERWRIFRHKIGFTFLFLLLLISIDYITQKMYLISNVAKMVFVEQKHRMGKLHMELLFVGNGIVYWNGNNKRQWHKITIMIETTWSAQCTIQFGFGNRVFPKFNAHFFPFNFSKFPSIQCVEFVIHLPCISRHWDLE